MRSERCACGATLRWPSNPRTWPRLQLAHNRTEQHLLWRHPASVETRLGPHVYEEHLALSTTMVRRVA